MGPRMKLPSYVHAFIDRHGKPRFYFRRAGFKKTPLPGTLVPRFHGDLPGRS